MTPCLVFPSDLCSPRLLTMLQEQVGSQLGQAGAPLKFALEVRLFALFPDPKGTNPKQIWGGVVQLEKR